MDREFFASLPSEIIIDILSRLPVRTVISCKCVCKPWLDLIESHEFVKSHFSKSVPALAVYQKELQSKPYKIFEFVDELDLQHHDLHYNPVISFDFPRAAEIYGSANGLLFLQDRSSKSDRLYICNPITRDYIVLNCPKEFAYSYPQIGTYGFGASKMTRQHKVVRIFHNCVRNQETGRWKKVPEAECHVYTLETGSWRALGPGAPLVYRCSNDGAFVNGNLHWLGSDLKDTPRISCFDLETELFTTFSPPPLLRRHPHGFVADVFALGHCLCLCDNGSDDEIVIWLMKEYGAEKSWTKEFVISKIPNFAGESHEVVRPIKVFKDGDILMAWEDYLMSYYSNKTKSIQQVDIFRHGCIDAFIHTPSFLSLKSYNMENVSSF